MFLKETLGVVLIDELDLHLHPNWQKHIVSDLKKAFPNIQFVATTHSPFIVQSLEANELINLDAANDNSPNDLSLGEVATNIMMVDSEYSLDNQQKEDTSQEYLQLLEKLNGADTNTIVSKLDELEIKIADPAIRAFLKMQRLKKQTQK